MTLLKMTPTYLYQCMCHNFVRSPLKSFYVQNYYYFQSAKLAIDWRSSVPRIQTDTSKPLSKALMGV